MREGRSTPALPWRESDLLSNAQKSHEQAKARVAKGLEQTLVTGSRGQPPPTHTEESDLEWF